MQTFRTPPMPAASTASATLSPRALALFSAALLTVLIPLGAIAALRWAPSSGALAPRMVAIEIGGRMLELDERMIRRGPQQNGGRLDRIDLVAGWPDFGPAELVTHDERGRLTAPGPAAHILMSIQPADDSIDPATRPLAVYSRFVEREVWSNPGGLIVRRFRAGSPFEGEELIMTPEGSEFAARCPAAATMGANGPPMRCLAFLRLAGLDATLSFDASALPEWRQLKSGALGLIGRALR